MSRVVVIGSKWLVPQQMSLFPSTAGIVILKYIVEVISILVVVSTSSSSTTPSLCGVPSGYTTASSMGIKKARLCCTYIAVVFSLSVLVPSTNPLLLPILTFISVYSVDVYSPCSVISSSKLFSLSPIFCVTVRLICVLNKYILLSSLFWKKRREYHIELFSQTGSAYWRSIVISEVGQNSGLMLSGHRIAISKCGQILSITLQDLSLVLFTAL